MHTQHRFDFSLFVYIHFVYTSHTQLPSTGARCKDTSVVQTLACPPVPVVGAFKGPFHLKLRPAASRACTHSMLAFRTRGLAVGAESRVNTVECPDRLTPVTDAFGLRKITRELIANALIPARYGNPGFRCSGCHAKCKSLVIAGRLLKIRMVVW